MAQSGTPPTQATLELNCMVFSDIEHLIIVEVANTSKVSKLQKAIQVKKEPELNHVSASALKLWKVAYCVFAVN